MTLLSAMIRAVPLLTVAFTPFASAAAQVVSARPPSSEADIRAALSGGVSSLGSNAREPPTGEREAPARVRPIARARGNGTGSTGRGKSMACRAGRAGPCTRRRLR